MLLTEIILLIQPEEVAKFYAGTDPRYPNTNWRKETLKSISPKYDINMGVRGGGDKVSYFLSLGYLNQKSLLRSDDINFNRISFRSNIDAQINSVLRLSADFSGRLEYRERPGRGMDVIMQAVQAAHPLYQLIGRILLNRQIPVMMDAGEIL